MVYVNPSEATNDARDVFDDAVADTWNEICEYFDVIAELPSVEALLQGSDVSDAYQAAETIVKNMLSEMVECVDRFSPWYTKPAKAYGLELVRDHQSGVSRWQISAEAKELWHDALDALSYASAECIGMLQAAQLIATLMSDLDLEQDKCMLAYCGCSSPRVIRVYRSVLQQSQIICENCKQPFRG